MSGATCVASVTPALGLAEALAAAGREDAGVRKVYPGFAELAVSEGLAGRTDLVERGSADVHAALGEVAGGEVGRRAPAGRGLAADLARPREDPAPQRQHRGTRAALEVIDDQHVAGRPVDQPAGSGAVAGDRLVELEADVRRGGRRVLRDPHPGEVQVDVPVGAGLGGEVDALEVVLVRRLGADDRRAVVVLLGPARKGGVGANGLRVLDPEELPAESVLGRRSARGGPRPCRRLEAVPVDPGVDAGSGVVDQIAVVILKSAVDAHGPRERRDREDKDCRNRDTGCNRQPRPALDPSGSTHTPSSWLDRPATMRDPGFHAGTPGIRAWHLLYG